jgi:hypothetical protein
MKRSAFHFRVGGSRIRPTPGFAIYRNIIVGIGLLAVGFLLTSKAISIYSQSNEKSISITPDGVVKPQIKIKDLKVGERNIKSNEVFADSSDWLGRASFKVENVSEKPITYMLIYAWLPETKSTGSVMVYQIAYGIFNPTRPMGAPFLLNPGDTFDISLADEYTKIESFVSSRHPISSIQKVRLEVGFLIFDDDTAWSAGAFLRRESDDPNRFIPQE